MAKKNTAADQAEEVEVIEIPAEVIEALDAPVVEEKKPAKAKPVESEYTAEELAANYKVFKTSYAVVIVALRLAGKKTATLSEAKKIIEEFKNKEVK